VNIRTATVELIVKGRPIGQNHCRGRRGHPAPGGLDDGPAPQLTPLEVRPLQSNNPAFNDNLLAHFDHAATRSTSMTVQGTSIKTLVLLAIVMGTAAWSWTSASAGQLGGEVLFGAAIGGFVVALITIFKPTLAPWTAPVYAALEGVFLGALSQQIDLRYPNTQIAMQAVALTGGVTFVMLFLYMTGLVRVTGQLATAITAATGAIALVYLVSFAMSFFGREFPYIHQAGPIGIGFSIFVVGLAAFNLLLDFDFIEKGSAAGLPKAMEWYGAFGLMVTLVWLYLEVLRLLRKLQDRR